MKAKWVPLKEVFRHVFRVLSKPFYPLQKVDTVETLISGQGWTHTMTPYGRSLSTSSSPSVPTRIGIDVADRNSITGVSYNGIFIDEVVDVNGRPLLEPSVSTTSTLPDTPAAALSQRSGGSGPSTSSGGGGGGGGSRSWNRRSGTIGGEWGVDRRQMEIYNRYYELYNRQFRQWDNYMAEYPVQGFPPQAPDADGTGEVIAPEDASRTQGLANFHAAVECPRCTNSFTVSKQERQYTCTNPECGHEFARKGLMHALRQRKATR